MKFPTRENIERWMFDYTEGNLSPEQETLLENYILNNPDLEVDLDAWQMATVPVENLVYTEKNKAYKKRRVLPYFISGIFAFLILSILTWNWNQNQNLKSDLKVNQQKQNAELNNNQFGNKNKNSNQGSETLVADLNQFSEPINNQNYISNFLNFNSENNNEISFDVNYNERLTTDFESLNTINLSSKSNFEKERLKTNALNSFILDGYQVRGEELITNEENANTSTGININTPKFLAKIEKVLSKDVALTNVPDHTYAIPELSDVDVLFSNIGSTSKARFYSTSRARWIGNVNQQKYSQQISFDSYLRGAKSAFGLQANYDYFGNGVIQNWNTALLFSPKIALSRNITFEPALRFKMGNKILTESKINNNAAVEFETGNVQTFNFDQNNAIGRKLWYRDLDAGFTINTSLFYIGFQSTNLLKHYSNIFTNTDSTVNERAQVNTSVIAGTQYISRNGKFVFSPYVYADFNKNANSIYGGFSMKLSKVMIGGSYSNIKAATGLIGLSTDKFSLFAQTTLAPSMILNENALTHQLTMRFNSLTSRKARRYITL